MSRCRTYRYLLQPTSRQRSGLERLCLNQCELYNVALEERRGAWAWERRSVSYVDQCRTLTETREVRPDLFECGVVVCRGTLMRLHRAFAAFYRRCRSGETPGYPRFKAASRFDSVQWEDTKGWGLETEAKRLRLLGIGHVKLRMHRPLRGTPKAITVSRQGQRWWVSIRCADVPAQPLPSTGQSVGIDLGVCALVATSDGELVREGRFAQKAKDRLAGAQRALATKRRGSMHRRRACEAVGRTHRRVANQRKDLAHQVSRRLVNDHDLIVVENLRVPQMSRRPKPRPNGKGGFDPNGARAKAGLNRSIADAGWGMLCSMLVYKAEDAGRELIAVDPRHTSLRCACCGHAESENRVSQAVFRCRGCGHEDHADINAARNILRAGRAQRASARAGLRN
jgi:putative transposase